METFDFFVRWAWTRNSEFNGCNKNIVRWATVCQVSCSEPLVSFEPIVVNWLSGILGVYLKILKSFSDSGKTITEGMVFSWVSCVKKTNLV